MFCKKKLTVPRQSIFIGISETSTEWANAYLSVYLVLQREAFVHKNRHIKKKRFCPKAKSQL